MFLFSDDFCDKSKHQWYRCDKPHPLCPSPSLNVIRSPDSPIKKGSKHNIHVKVIDKNKPRRTEEPKILKISPSKPLTTAINNIASKAVSAVSNCISSIFATNTTGNMEATPKNDKGIQRSEVEKNQMTTENEKDQPGYGQDEDDAGTNRKQDQMDDLIEDFRTHALNVDDAMFDKLFEKLKKELDRLACECQKTTGQQSKLEDSGIAPKSNDLKNKTSDAYSNYSTKDDLKTMFVELKEMLQKNFCGDIEARKSGVKEITGSKNGIKCPGVKGGCDCKEKSKSETDVKIKRNSKQATPKEFVGYYNTIISKLDKITRYFLDGADHKHDGSVKSGKGSDTKIAEDSTSRHTNLSGSDSTTKDSSTNTRVKKGSHDKRKRKSLEGIRTNVTKTAEDSSSGHTKLSGSESITKESSTNTRVKRGSKGKKKGKSLEEIRMNAIDNIEKSVSRAHSENGISLDQFNNLANELKEAIQKSACECKKSASKLKPTKKAEKEVPEQTLTENKNSDCSNGNHIIINETVPLPHALPTEISPDTPQEISNQLVEEEDHFEDPILQDEVTPLTAVPNPQNITWLQKVAEDPMRLSDLFRVQPQRSPVDSPAESFYSAQCSNVPNGENREKNVGVNTQCKCFTDQVIQTFGNVKLSYGVFCSEECEQDSSEVSDVQIRRQVTQEGDVEKIRVRIRLKGDETETETKRITESPVFSLDKSSRFMRNGLDYGIRYETLRTEIDEAKVIRDGNRIKIFIPIESGKIKFETKEDDGSEYFSIDTKKQAPSI